MGFKRRKNDFFSELNSVDETQKITNTLTCQIERTFCIFVGLHAENIDCFCQMFIPLKTCQQQTSIESVIS